MTRWWGSRGQSGGRRPRGVVVAAVVDHMTSVMVEIDGAVADGEREALKGIMQPVGLVVCGDDDGERGVGGRRCGPERRKGAPAGSTGLGDSSGRGRFGAPTAQGRAAPTRPPYQMRVVGDEGAGVGGLDDGRAPVRGGCDRQGGADVHDHVVDAGAVEVVEDEVARLEGGR